MITSRLSSFRARVEADPALQAKLAALSAPNREEWAAAVAILAEQSGTPVPVKDILESLNAREELSETELEKVAGGVKPGCFGQGCGGPPPW